MRFLPRPRKSEFFSGEGQEEMSALFVAVCHGIRMAINVSAPDVAGIRHQANFVVARA